jgi:ATP/maltotriose-dependent transcriptional regulator MalT/DNA-binding SARP family transcriptional activator
MGGDVRGGVTAADAPGARVSGPAMLERPGLERRLDDVLDRRLALVEAGAGYGKTTLVQNWSRGHRVAWHTVGPDDREVWVLARNVAQALRAEVRDLEVTGLPAGAGAEDDARQTGRLAAYLCGAVAGHLHDDLVLVLDDVHEIGASDASGRLLTDLCRQAPDRLHLVLVSRPEVSLRIARLRAQGQVCDITGRDLAFDVSEVADLLAGALGTEARVLAPALDDATGGWPAAVRLAVEALRSASHDERERILANLVGPDGPMFTWLTEEVLAREPPDVAALLRTVAPLNSFNGDLAAALGVCDARDLVASLEHRGLLLVPHGAKPGWCTLHPLVRAVVDQRNSDAERTAALASAAAWFEGHGDAREALACRRRAGDWPGAARVLREHGGELVLAGAALEVLTTTAGLPASEIDADVLVLEADAHLTRGDLAAAMACLDPLVPPEGQIPLRYALRAGLAHIQRGDLVRGLSVFARAERNGGPDADRAELLAWEATTRQQCGEWQRTSELADRAAAAAHASHDDRALAAAYAAKGYSMFDGDPGAARAHFSRARMHAERAGDIAQLTKVTLQLGALRFLRGDYRDALAELDAAVYLTDVSGVPGFRELVITLRGHVLLRLGRVEEARRDAEAARHDVFEQGSTSAAYPSVLLGEIHRECGELALSIAAFEQALDVADRSNNIELLVPALTGIAGLVCRSDPDRAEALVERALVHTRVSARAAALLVGGWVALVAGNRDLARARADEATAVARRRHEPPALAGILELRAAMEEEGTRRQELLEEAHSVWRALGDPLGEARTGVALARLAHENGDDDAAREVGSRVRDCLHQVGVRRLAARADHLLGTVERRGRKPVEVTTLGVFSVAVDGQRLDARAWQSRKARDLLKILVSRRGRPVHREVLIDLLWPDDGSERGSSRLSVALSTLRGVLDPEKQHQSDAFVASDGAAVWLCLDRVAVDLESFLADAAADRLAAADAAYTGDFLEEDAYADWAAPLREEARLAYVSVARALADDAARAGDHDDAVRHLLRVLDRDPYDESAHLAIVAAFADAGRHGEARRAYQTYCARMEELGVEPAMFPSSARPSPTKVD